MPKMFCDAQSLRGPRLRRSSDCWPTVPVAIAIPAFCLLLLLTVQAQEKAGRRVLILYESSPNSPLVRLVDEGVEAALNNSPYRVEFYREYMETASFPDPADQQEFREFYARKYRNRLPDAIIAVGPSPLQFMVETHKQSFPGVPIIYCLPNRIAGGFSLDSDFTGVQGDIAPAQTLDVGLRLRPDTTHVVVVGGTTPFDKQQLAAIHEQLRPYEGRLDISYISDFTMPDLLDRLRHLPIHTIVLLGALGRDAAGNRFTTDQSGQMVVSAANVPVFSLNDRNLNHGEVGGDVADAVEQGKIAGGMTLRLLNGEKPKDIAPMKDEATFEFDWHALKRWGMKEGDLPPGSIVLNRQRTVWESYKWYIIGGISLILAEAILIFALAWQRAGRKKAETELGIAYDRLRQAVEAGKCVGWEWDVKTGHDRWFGDLETMFGIKSHTYFGHVEEFRRRVHPEDQELVWKAVADARQNREPFTAEFRILRLDGTVRWLTEKGQFYYAANGDAVRMVGMAVDITDRKQAEQLLREGEERFRLVANTAPVMIWMAGTDKLCTYVNQPWLEFTGRSLEAELGNGCTESVHPEDLRGSMRTYTQAFDRKESFQMEYRLRRRDGEYRWLADIGVPRFNPDHSFAGYIGSCTDVTERKIAEESLADVGRKLIEAHEEERTWIARELHDDVNQQLALLAVDLDQWNQQLPVELRNHIHHASKRLSDIAKDIQALSHRLHSSKLEYLGIVAAARSFCKELSEQKKVEIDFSHTAIPRVVPKEISLCLFRVLQETLQNAVKHSGVRHFRVELCGTEREIQLTVSDRGVGFDPQAAIRRRGIGLISMRERMQLVSGEISITSHPGAGTTIHARVPLKADKYRAMVG